MKELNFDDVLIQPKNSKEIKSRSDICLFRHIPQMNSTVIPVINANMTQTGNKNMAMKMLYRGYPATLHKFYSNDEILHIINECKNEHLSTQQLFITFGLRELKKMKEFAFLSEGLNFSILLDVPNGYIESFLDLIKLTRKLFPNKYIMAGNVCDYKGTAEILKAGANCVKVGINPGLSCRTKQTTGCGRKQLSAILDCAKAAKKYNGHICADGGCREVADICKAFVAGADFVMLGGMLAGANEASGESITKCFKTNEYTTEEYGDTLEMNRPIFEYKHYKEFYGMSSFHAQQENYGKKTVSGTSEGVESLLVESTGPLENTLNRIEGGLRSCCSYTGALIIQKLKNAKFYI